MNFLEFAANKDTKSIKLGISPLIRSMVSVIMLNPIKGEVIPKYIINLFIFKYKQSL